MFHLCISDLLSLRLASPSWSSGSGYLLFGCSCRASVSWSSVALYVICCFSVVAREFFLFLSEVLVEAFCAGKYGWCLPRLLFLLELPSFFVCRLSWCNLVVSLFHLRYFDMLLDVLFYLLMGRSVYLSHIAGILYSIIVVYFYCHVPFVLHMPRGPLLSVAHIMQCLLFFWVFRTSFVSCRYAILMRIEYPMRGA